MRTPSSIRELPSRAAAEAPANASAVASQRRWSASQRRWSAAPAALVRRPSGLGVWAPLRRTGLLYAACGNGKDEIVYILANSSRLNKDDKVTPLRVTFYKVGALGRSALRAATVSQPAKYPVRHGIPTGTVSQPARCPV